MPGFHQEFVVTPSIINVRGIILVMSLKIERRKPLWSIQDFALGFRKRGLFTDLLVLDCVVMGKNLLLIVVPVPVFTFLPSIAQCRASPWLTPTLPAVSALGVMKMVTTGNKHQSWKASNGCKAAAFLLEYRDLSESKDWLLGKAQNWLYTSAQSFKIKTWWFCCIKI